MQHVLDQALNDEDEANATTASFNCSTEKEVSLKINAAKEYLWGLPLSHLNSDELRIEVSHAKVRLLRLRAIADADSIIPIDVTATAIAAL